MISKHNDSTLLLDAIKIFNPLIRKYSRMLNYCEAETDLIIALINIFRRLPKSENNAIIIGYIAKSLRHEYISLSRRRQMQLRNEYITDEVFVPEKSLRDIELTMDIKNALAMLTYNQKRIIYSEYYLGYSDSEMASLLNISRQAVNKSKRASIRKLRLLLGR